MDCTSVYNKLGGGHFSDVSVSIYRGNVPAVAKGTTQIIVDKTKQRIARYRFSMSNQTKSTGLILYNFASLNSKNILFRRS